MDQQEHSANPLHNERVLVTGGAGFIGSHLVRRLLDVGSRVAVLDNFSSGRRENLLDLLSDIELLEADIRDEDALRRAVRGRSAVFHLAAVVSVPQSVTDPATTHAVTVGGSVHLLCAARDAGAHRVVMASSSAVYGENEVSPKTEESAPSPTSPYGAAKLAMEGFGQAFAASYGLSVTSLRYFNVYGPRQDPAGQYAAVIPRFITALLSGRSPVIFGDGGQTRDFVHVHDVVQANLLAAVEETAAGRVLNIAGGTPHSILALYETLRRITASAAEPIFAEVRPGDIRHSHASTALARDLLGFRPQVSLDKGLALTVDWYRNSWAAN